MNKKVLPLPQRPEDILNGQGVRISVIGQSLSVHFRHPTKNDALLAEVLVGILGRQLGVSVEVTHVNRQKFKFCQNFSFEKLHHTGFQLSGLYHQIKETSFKHQKIDSGPEQSLEIPNGISSISNRIVDIILRDVQLS